jgi:hypothetical protein
MKRYGIFFILLALILVSALFYNKEGFFGTSPGTLVQLATSHVPTEEDISQAKLDREQVRKDIYDMTESDLV